MGMGGFSVEEEDNVITVHSDVSMGGNLIITVPQDTSVQLKTTNGGISVQGVRGEIEVGSANGKAKSGAQSSAEKERRMRPT